MHTDIVLELTEIKERLGKTEHDVGNLKLDVSKMSDDMQQVRHELQAVGRIETKVDNLLHVFSPVEAVYRDHPGELLRGIQVGVNLAAAQTNIKAGFWNKTGWGLAAVMFLLIMPKTEAIPAHISRWIHEFNMPFISEEDKDVEVTKSRSRVVGQ